MIEIKTITDLLKGEKAARYIIIMGIVGIALVMFSDFGAKKKEEVPEIAQTHEYVKTVEANLQSILEKTKGVGKASVMITLEGGQQYIYAQNEKQNTNEVEDMEDGKIKKSQKTSDGENTFVFANTGSGGKPIKITELLPKVKGVLVVCEGGGSSVIKACITEAVSTALGIGYSQIYVSQSK
ncbi:MAG: hypothetical protein RSB05_07875 [Clostridiales bacterium]